jgi:hypothetical protein
VTGLVYSIYIGKRRGWGTERLLFKPHNVSHVVRDTTRPVLLEMAPLALIDCCAQVIGTVFLWVGWIGFNGGSTFAANIKAALAIFNTNLAGSTAGLTWMVMDFRLERKWSVVGFCTGAICGRPSYISFSHSRGTRKLTTTVPASRRDYACCRICWIPSCGTYWRRRQFLFQPAHVAQVQNCH